MYFLYFSLAVTRSKNVPIFGPPIPKGAMFPKSQAFTKFLLSKLINAENAVHRCVLVNTFLLEKCASYLVLYIYENTSYSSL